MYECSIVIGIHTIEIMKKILSLLLTITMCLTLCIPVTASASSSEEFINQDTAATIALLFVADNVFADENITNWDVYTTINDIIPVYDSNDEINGYCILLKTGSNDSGYITVSASSASYLISEYSDTAAPTFFTPENVANNSFGETGRRIYYLCPLEFVESHPATPSVATQSESNTLSAFVKSNENISNNQPLLDLIAEYGPINSRDLIDPPIQTRGDTAGSWIENPLTYLRNVYGETYTLFHKNDSLDGVLGAWNQGNTMTCSIHMLAALAYVNRDSISDEISSLSLTAIYNNLLSYAETTPYYDENNGVEFYDIAPLGNVWLASIDSTWRCGAAASWVTCENEIDEGRAVGINIANGYYSNHSVTGYCYYIYEAISGRYDTFIKIRDGYDSRDRYIHCDMTSLYTVTTMQPR